jgi:hypothetical protein
MQLVDERLFQFNPLITNSCEKMETCRVAFEFYYEKSVYIIPVSNTRDQWMRTDPKS